MNGWDSAKKHCAFQCLGKDLFWIKESLKKRFTSYLSIQWICRDFITVLTKLYINKYKKKQLQLEKRDDVQIVVIVGSTILIGTVVSLKFLTNS